MFEIESLSRRLGDGAVTLAISGGVDSMVLLHVIASNLQKFHCKFKVVHVNHGLCVESAAWSEMVHEVSRGYDLPCVTFNVDVPRDGNLEAQARSARYMALSLGSDAIITAHHMDDQAETVLMKLLRGSGPRGLMGMPRYGSFWMDNNVLHCRPMIDISRDEIMAYAKLCQLRYVVDPSNKDTSFDRNWLRNDVIPVLKDRKPSAVENMARSASIIGEAVTLMADLAEIDLSTVKREDGHLDWPKMKNLGRVRTKNLILHIVQAKARNTCSTHQIDMFVDGLMAADADSRNELRCRGLRISKIGHKIVLCD